MQRLRTQGCRGPGTERSRTQKLKDTGSQGHKDAQIKDTEITGTGMGAGGLVPWGISALPW